MGRFQSESSNVAFEKTGEELPFAVLSTKVCNARDQADFGRGLANDCFRTNGKADSLLRERANIGRDISSVHDCLADKPVKVT